MISVSDFLGNNGGLESFDDTVPSGAVVPSQDDSKYSTFGGTNLKTGQDYETNQNTGKEAWVGGRELETGRAYEINPTTGEKEWLTPMMRDGRPLLPETTPYIRNGKEAMPIDPESNVHPDTKLRDKAAIGVWEGPRPIGNILKSMLALQNADGDLYQRYDNQGNPTYKVIKFEDGTEYKYDMQNKALLAKMYDRYNTTPSWDPSDAPALYGIGRVAINSFGNGVGAVAKATIGKSLIPHDLIPKLPKLLDPMGTTSTIIGGRVASHLPGSLAEKPMAKAASELGSSLGLSAAVMYARRHYRPGAGI